MLLRTEYINLATTVLNLLHLRSFALNIVIIMFGKQTVANLRWLIICTFLTSVSSVTLNQATRRPRPTKYSSSSTVLAPAIGSLVTPTNDQNPPVVSSDGVALYRANTSNGATCILLQTDGIIEVNFKSHTGDEKGDTYMPEKPAIQANCRYEDAATMTLTWNGYSLSWNFAKTPGGERWYVDRLELTVSKSLAPYHSLQISGDSFKLVHDQMLFLTPVGMSYACEESDVELVPPNPESSPTGLRGTLLLRTLQVQPFMYKGSNFGPPFECNAQLGFRDETAPIAVGSTLAIAVLMTVTGYGIFRYFKIKKVQYKTME